MDELKKFSKRLNDLSSVLNPVMSCGWLDPETSTTPGAGQTSAAGSGAKWPGMLLSPPTPCSSAVLLCWQYFFHDCLPYDPLCFLRADLCLPFLSLCVAYTRLEYTINVQLIFAESVCKWVKGRKEGKKGIVKISKLQSWILIACFLNASMFNSDISVRSHLGVFEFLYFCRFWSPVQSSHVDE